MEFDFENCLICHGLDCSSIILIHSEDYETLAACALNPEVPLWTL